MYEDLDKKQIRSYRGEIVAGSVLLLFVLFITHSVISSGWLLNSDTRALLKEESYLKEETENESDNEAEKEPRANRQYKLGVFYLNGGVVWRNYDKAFNLFSLAEKNGNTDAKQALMECYRNGYGCPKDTEKAEEILWKLNSTLINARNGNTASQYQAGVWYYNGKGELSVNKEKAIYWFTQAAVNGNRDAINMLIEHYRKAKDEKKANDVLWQYEPTLSRANSGDTDAQYKVGQWYFHGDNILSKNTKEAIIWFHRSVAHGNKEAMKALEMCYRNGIGAEKNIAEADKYLWQYEPTLSKAKSGDTNAQYEVGILYLDGKGILLKNEKVAVEWFHLSARQGNIKAFEKLEYCYRNGIGIQKDAKEADRLNFQRFLLEAKNGDEDAMKIVEHRLRTGTSGVEQNIKEADEWQLKREPVLIKATSGDADAQYEVGMLYFKGDGILPKDEAKAFEWFKKSATRGNIDAMKMLERCYNDGIGTEPNGAEAKKWRMKYKGL